MTNLPKTVQWVLDFLNINSKPGKPDLYRLPCELRSLKRPPRPEITPSLKIADNTHTLIDENTGYRWRIKDNKPPEERIDLFALLARLRALEQRKMELLRQPKKKKIKPIEELSWSEAIEELQKFQSEKGEDAIPKQNIREIIENLDLEKDLEFDGINNAPTLEDFKQFFLKEGIPPYKGKELMLENGKPLSSLNIKSYNNRPKNNSEDGFYDYYQDNPRIEHTFYKVVSNERCELSRILSNIVHGTKSYGDERKATEVLKGYMKGITDQYLEFWKGNEVPADSGITSWGEPYRGRYAIVMDSMRNKEPFPHYGMIPHALYACILDFGINHKELHQYLRQCPHCGTFEIPEKKRGRPEKFCSDVCRERHDDQPREANKKSVVTTRKHQKKEKQKEDCRTLVEYLKQKTYTQKDAEDAARNWVYTYGKSFKEYKRTQGTILKGL